MDNTFFTNILILIAIFVFGYYIFNVLFRNVHLKEGMENNDSTSTSSSTTSSSSSTDNSNNGVAGNAATYAANIKASAIKLQDTALIAKYRSDYEKVVLNLDDLVDNLMLQTTLSMDKKNPMSSLNDLVILNNSKLALNNVMKFIDSQ
jgi:hypothetical protein